MLCACLASGYRATDAFIASTLQKHLFREMRLYDTAAHNKDALKWGTIPRRWGMNKSGEADEGADDEPTPEGTEGDERNPAPQLPTKDNPAIFALYGHICLAGKSYQSAICACPPLFSIYGLTDRLQSTFSTHTITAQMTL
jgi:general transcription factor 3C polypeptide 3 (transcription factor C subunit 4)